MPSSLDIRTFALSSDHARMLSSSWRISGQTASFSSQLPSHAPDWSHQQSCWTPVATVSGSLPSSFTAKLAVKFFTWCGQPAGTNRNSPASKIQIFRFAYRARGTVSSAFIESMSAWSKIRETLVVSTYCKYCVQRVEILWIQQSSVLFVKKSPLFPPL